MQPMLTSLLHLTAILHIIKDRNASALKIITLLR